MTVREAPQADPADMSVRSDLTTPSFATKRITSKELFERAREIEIDHEGRIYRLRLTQLNKLILTA